MHKYTWLRISERRVVYRALMYYVLLSKRMLGRLLDVKVWIEGEKLVRSE